jgi:hypothetical protein
VQQVQPERPICRYHLQSRLSGQTPDSILVAKSIGRQQRSGVRGRVELAEGFKKSSPVHVIADDF